MRSLVELIRELIKLRFYGSLDIRFEAGKVVYVKKTETIKVADS